MKKRINKSEVEVDFPGYDPFNCQEQFFIYPMKLEQYWCDMTGSEQKVLTFIIRKTFGWQKQGDYIALSQFTQGDGTGFGTGLSRSQVKRSIITLEKKGFIRVDRFYRKPSYFELPLSEEARGGVAEHGAMDGVYKQGLTKSIRATRHAYSASYMKEVFDKDGRKF